MCMGCNMDLFTIQFGQKKGDTSIEALKWGIIMIEHRWCPKYWISSVYVTSKVTLCNNYSFISYQNNHIIIAHLSVESESNIDVRESSIWCKLLFKKLVFKYSTPVRTIPTDPRFGYVRVSARPMAGSRLGRWPKLGLGYLPLLAEPRPDLLSFGLNRSYIEKGPLPHPQTR